MVVKKCNIVIITPILKIYTQACGQGVQNVRSCLHQATWRPRKHYTATTQKPRRYTANTLSLCGQKQG